ncbi:MAG: murein L,D-transpeptidase [Kangiellaceae bacterium]|nr:murein L,D-transpeptidase [Kangiellaceae bacterium]
MKPLSIPSSKRSLKAITRAYPLVEPLMDAQGLTRGSQVFIRIFKQESELEVWLKGVDSKFKLFKIYPICTYSGKLGPKQRQGDKQSPEGFYYVKPKQLNPWSRFHLSFNLGYPNKFDRAHGRTGDALMVHGDCVSIGCYAMTDPYIEQIYTLMHQAFEQGQPFIRVHIFPFKMTEQNLNRYKNHKWHNFWLNLKQGYDWFEAKYTPPNVEVAQKRYVFGD